MTKICFDCNGTLLDFNDNPRQEIVNLFKALEKIPSIELYIWSHAGIDFAKQTAIQLKLKARIVKKLSFTPDIMVDDNNYDYIKCIKIKV
jgi:hypothetical protein